MVEFENVGGGGREGHWDRLPRNLVRTATSNSDAALPNIPSYPPHGYGFGEGTDSHTRTRTPAYPWPVPARVSVPVSFTRWEALDTFYSLQDTTPMAHIQ